MIRAAPRRRSRGVVRLKAVNSLSPPQSTPRSDARRGPTDPRLGPAQRHQQLPGRAVAAMPTPFRVFTCYSDRREPQTLADPPNTAESPATASALAAQFRCVARAAR